MLKFEYLSFKRFPINLGSAHGGIVEAKTLIKARKKLEKKFSDFQIIRRIE